MRQETTVFLVKAGKCKTNNSLQKQSVYAFNRLHFCGSLYAESTCTTEQIFQLLSIQYEKKADPGRVVQKVSMLSFVKLFSFYLGLNLFSVNHITFFTLYHLLTALCVNLFFLCTCLRLITYTILHFTLRFSPCFTLYYSHELQSH